MKEYTFIVWLLTPASVDRIILELIRNKYSISPGYRERIYSHSSSASHTFNATVSNESFPLLADINKALIEMLEQMDVPYFGAIVMEGVPKRFSSCGRMPEIKKVKAIPAGPYRTQGEVIQFPFKKDDGIIDE